MVHVLLVDVNVDMKGMHVVQNVVMVAMISIVIHHVMGVYLMTVIRNMVIVQIHLDVGLDGSMDIRNVIKYVNQGHLEITALRTATVSVNANVIKQLVYVRTISVSKGGWGKLVVKNATMVPTALIVKKHAIHVKARLVKDLKEIVQMDVLKTSRDINVNFQ